MAEQATKLGGRLRELRDERNWKAKHVVAEMAKLGDLSLNTGQLSRYENGGAFPGEVRLERFAKVFGTDSADLLAGPVAERRKQKASATALAVAEAEADQLNRIEAKLDRLLEAAGLPAGFDSIVEELEQTIDGVDQPADSNETRTEEQRRASES